MLAHPICRKVLKDIGCHRTTIDEYKIYVTAGTTCITRSA